MVTFTRLFTRSPRRLAAALILAALLLTAGGALARAASRPAPLPESAPRQGTPVPLQLPTFTPTQGPPTETPTRTPTSEGRAMIEALSDDTNVRADADIAAPVVGKIFPGFKYPVIGKLFKWFYIEFPDSPSGVGWVFEDVVSLTGDQAQITIYEPGNRPGVDPSILAGQQTAEAITLTPGLAFTMTAESQITPTGILATGAADSAGVPGSDGRLPTFTFPPYTLTPIPVPQAPPVAATETGGIPPLLPIVALGALGLMGLLVALLRRL